MGWALRSGDHVSNPTLEVHPHDPSREFRLAFRTVNLKVAHLAHIGTFPVFFSSEEQRCLWAQKIRRLKTVRCVLRLVDDDEPSAVDVKPSKAGYLASDA